MMNFFIYLPIAGASVNIFLLLGLGGAVGFLSGLFGVGGGFLLTPLLLMIGINPVVAAASDSNQIVAASSSGMYAHWKAGNVDFKMGFILILGGILGGTMGVHVIKILRQMGNADFLIKTCYVIMLGVVGPYMFYESLTKLRPRKKAPPQVKTGGPGWLSKIFTNLPFQMHFEKSGVSMSVIIPFLLGILVGVLAAIMGVGGGFIMVPIMVYLLRMPMHVVVGTSLFQVLFTCVNVTFMQAYTNHSVDLVLALLLLAGSTLGAQFGAQVSQKLKADQLKILLSIIIIITMVKMLSGLLIAPDLLFMLKGGH